MPHLKEQVWQKTQWIGQNMETNQAIANLISRRCNVKKCTQEDSGPPSYRMGHLTVKGYFILQMLSG